MRFKTVYICQSCQEESPKWQGRCPSCEAWNSLTEETIAIEGKSSKNKISNSPRTLVSSSINDSIELKNFNLIPGSTEKVLTGIQEFDIVMGNGILPGSLTLLAGEPGIGKSTLTLQICKALSQNFSTLIVSGEESVEQIAMRAKRLKINENNLSLANEYQIENIINIINKNQPKFVVIDSIQVVSSSEIPGSAGSITQVRYCTEALLEVAKKSKIAIIIIGHVTKDGQLAGPRVLEHLVDTVLHFEGDRYRELRILRAVKNRFGATNESGLFEMTENGLTQANNPSAKLLEERPAHGIGSAITASLEGTRPFLVEVQALVTPTHFGYPKRAANGFDLNRLQILIAVLEKYGKIKLENHDVFINIAGGLRLREPAADLAVCLSIASSLLQKPLPETAIAFGEIGLSGEIRKVSSMEKRLKEAQKFGLTQEISPQKFKKILDAISSF